MDLFRFRFRVQIASLMVCVLDLDMLACVRTCPYQSWQNVVECIVSTLNLALQNVPLARTSTLYPRDKELVKNKQVYHEVPELSDALRDSMAQPFHDNCWLKVPVYESKRILSSQVYLPIGGRDH